MKRATIVLTVILLLSLVSTAAAGTKGNGAPSGPHYNLNIIGVPKGKTADMTGDNGHRIFVPLGKDGKVSTKIMLFEGDFQVLDANGTDGEASFQLPDPGDPVPVEGKDYGNSAYSVWARAVGTPGGSADMYTCAYDPVAQDTLCSEAILEMKRTKGKVGSFGDVSKYLLYMYVCQTWGTDGEGNDVCTRAVPVNIFDAAYQDYFWQYDNNGLKVLQLRFYPGVPGKIPNEWPF